MHFLVIKSMGKEESLTLVGQELRKPDTFLFKAYKDKLLVLVGLFRKKVYQKIMVLLRQYRYF
jgi:hypothetical protein